MPTTIGQIYVNEALPPEYRDYSRVMGASEMKAVLTDIAKNRPDKYREVSAALMRVGNKFAYEGGTTLRLSDIAPPIDRRPLYAGLDRAENAIRSSKLSDEEKTAKLRQLYEKAYEAVKGDTYDTAIASNNPFAIQVKSKARGNQDQLSAMVSTPGVYANSKGETIPMFIRHSYAEGLSPAEIWAGAYGARTGVVSTKFSTRQAGELGKLLTSASIEQVVTEDDCGTVNGMPASADDNDNIGALLAAPVAGYDAGTVITKSVLSDIRKAGEKDILVRSPITCGAKNGVCSHCAGVRETGGLPPIGYNLGTNSASALAERLAQGSLNCLAEGTLVRMADGSTKPIERIVPGELVLGSDVHGNVRPTRVVHWYDNGMQPCVRTTFTENGTQHRKGRNIVLDSTIIHKLLCTRVVSGQKDEALNWTPRVLPVGTKSREFFAYTVSSFDDTGLVDEPLAMLIGALLGDGCYTKSVGGVHISCADDTEIDDLNDTLSGFDIRIKRLKYHDGIYYRVSQSRPRSGRNEIKNYLVKHGMYGKRANEKELPSVVHSWSNKSVGALIGGLIATDGSVYSSDSNGKPGVSFASTSRRLVEQVKDLLILRFGIVGSKITKTGHAGDNLRKFDQYQFTITKPNEVRKLASVVSIPGVKRERLHRMLDEYKPSGKTVHTAFRRVSQVGIGIRHVYDIEVDCPDHIFLLGNGLIVSNTKHSGKKIKGKGHYQGFDMIKRMATVPKNYADRATVSELDGTVEKIVNAPQGGHFVVVGGQRHYVPADYDILVKEGDSVEAGDQLSDGVISPADAVRLKGIGEGRRYFANRFTQAFRDSGYAVNRRNVEAVAKALINNVVVENEDAEAQMLPGDTVTYGRWSWGYKPRPNSTQVSPKAAIGQYLEQPALHYTIGTRITKKVADELNKFKVQNVLANKIPVGVRPEMQSVVATTGNKGDWMARLGTTYLGKRLVEDAQMGSESNVHGVNPYPGIAKGTEFGQWGTPGHRDGPFTY